jgi:lauroyl/myristoyl acyltransferase
MGGLDLIVVPRQARLYEAAVADGARRLGCDWDVRSVSRSLGRQTYRWRVRDLLLDDRPGDRAAPPFHVSGRDRLDAAVAAGRGVILLANHFGAHVLIAHWMFRRGYPLRWFGERPRNVSGYLTRQFQADGPLGQARLFLSRRAGVTEAASSVALAARMLNAGLIVKVACDVRWEAGKVAEATFLGRRESFAASWAFLAAMTGAAVVPAFCRSDEAGAYHLEFDEPFSVPPDARRGDGLAPWVQLALDGVARRVREHPEQSNDYFFWEASGADRAGRPPASPAARRSSIPSHSAGS